MPRVDLVETDRGPRIVRPRPTHLGAAMLTNTSLHLPHVASVRPAIDRRRIQCRSFGGRGSHSIKVPTYSSPTRHPYCSLDHLSRITSLERGGDAPRDLVRGPPQAGRFLGHVPTRHRERLMTEDMAHRKRIEAVVAAECDRLTSP